LRAVIEVRGVSFSYEAVDVLREVSVSVGEGELLGLIGPNGSGKTTLIRCMAGALRPKLGVVLLEGRAVAEMGPREVARRLAVVPQDHGSPFDFTVVDVVSMGRYPHLGRLGRASRRDLEAVERAMELAGVKQLAHRRLCELSGGERQRVFIARALAQEPEVLLLDEPTAHLDLGHQLELMELVRRLCREEGLTTVVAIHDLNLAARYCDRLVLLSGGRIRAMGPVEEVLREDLIGEVYGVEVEVWRHPATGSLHVIPISVRPREACAVKGGLEGVRVKGEWDKYPAE